MGDVLKDVRLQRAGEVPTPPADACPHCHGAGYLRYDVSVDDPRFGQLVACECTVRALERRRIERLVERSNLGALRRLTFDSFILKVREGTPPVRTPDAAWRIARSYAENPHGWLVLYGAFGTGKTHLAAAVANHRIEAGHPAVFIVVPDLLDHLRSTFSPSSEVTYDELFETVRDTPLLILDDLGTQTSTPWAQEKLYQILNHRYNTALPTVITTNLSPDEIEPRLRSRLGDSHLSKLVEIRDIDKRLGVTHEAGRRTTRRPRDDHRL
ncbi:MAG TPA: ATP-binding protein [Chloroflexota bacterium]|nr:ATP-binding protein [Chloroflexota bacterium]